MACADYLANGKISDRCECVRMQLERRGPFPRAGDFDIAQEEAHQFANARRSIDVRNHFEQIIRCVGELATLGGRIDCAILVAHRSGGDALRAVVERTEQRILAIDAQFR